MINKKKTKEYESKLTELIKQICCRVGLSFEEWDMDKKLYLALITSEKFPLAKDMLREYQSILEVTRISHININKKFYWFNNLS